MDAAMNVAVILPTFPTSDIVDVFQVGIEDCLRGQGCSLVGRVLA